MLRAFGARRFRDLVDGVEVLVAGREEAELLAGTDDPERAAADLATAHELVVVTLGDAGALARTGDRVVRVPAVPAEAVDVTGAGDAFAAGLVAGLVGGDDLEDALTAGVPAGGDGGHPGRLATGVVLRPRRTRCPRDRA